MLTIPSVSSLAIPNPLLRQTIFYSTGWVLSRLYYDSRLDNEVAPLIIIFIAKQSLSLQQAMQLKLPLEFLASRSRGGLMYPSCNMFDIIFEIEHAFSFSTYNT